VYSVPVIFINRVSQQLARHFLADGSCVEREQYEPDHRTLGKRAEWRKFSAIDGWE
jgi:hypothetical protein